MVKWVLGCHCTVPKLKTKRHQSGTAGVTDVKDHKHQVATSLYKHQMATSLYRHQWPHHCTGIRWPHHCTHIRWPHHCTHIRWPYHCTNINGHIIVQTPVATSLYRHQWPHHCTDASGHIIVQASGGHIIEQTPVATSLYTHQVATPQLTRFLLPKRSTQRHLPT